MTIHLGKAAANPERPEETDTNNGLFDASFRPLTADEAREFRIFNPPTSLWRAVVWQIWAGSLLAMVSGLAGGWYAGMSTAYGALAVVLPTALMVRGLERQRGVTQASAAMLGFVFWELVKIAATVAMLVLAPKLIEQLHWLALVAGFVLTMKVHWVTAWLYSKRTRRSLSN